MERKDFYIPSRDGVHKLHVVLWEPDMAPRAVVQISHGMTEMIDRYEDFAMFLTRNGYAVIGNDHLGHGLTAGNDSDLGYFCPKNMSATVVADLHRVTKYAKKKFKGIPYFLLGHSMGSFMARRYIMTYGMDLDGAVLCGTGSKSRLVLTVGELVSNVQRALFGDRFRSRLLRKSAFDGYLKRIPNPRTASDWLTRDGRIVDFCRGNKYCSFLFTDLDGAVLCGTGSKSRLVLTVGELVSNVQRALFGDRFRSRLLRKSAFDGYLKRIPNPRTASDWLTRDGRIVDFCRGNKYCSFLFTVNGYRTIFDVLQFIQNKCNINRIPKELPLFFIAGGEDPVGHYGRDVQKISTAYKKAGMEMVSVKIYPQDRHEILNELDKNQVYQDVISWLNVLS